MTVQRTLERGRLAARRLMVDTCTVTRPGAFGAPDESTGIPTRTTTSVYSGACRVKPEQPGEQSAGEREVVTRRFVVSLPADTDGVAVGDVVTVTASVYDAGLVGASLVVVGVPVGSHLTARRLLAEWIEN